MISSRFTTLAALAATTVVLGGLATGAFLYLAGEEVSAKGPAFRFLPAGANLVGYLDMKALAKSPLAESWASISDRKEWQGLEEIRENVGIDLLEDVDSLTLAVAPGPDDDPRWGIVLEGAFERKHFLDKLEKAHPGLETSRHEGTDLYIVKGASGSAFALPGPTTLLFGETDYVREMLDAAAGRKPSVPPETWGKSDVEVDALNGPESFWLAGKPPEFVRASGPGSSIQSFRVSGHLGSELFLHARGRTADEKSAQELANVVRGLIALARLRGDSTAERATLEEAMESISIETAGDSVDLSLSMPYESVREILEPSARAQGEPEGQR
jgi:hypothetical protein